MFKLQDAYKEITLDDIYSKISDYELWRKYCINFIDIDKPFLSDLYDDKNPSCRIFYNNSNKLIYKDFGNGGITYGIFDYIQAKYSISFKQCIQMIVSDFNLSNFTKKSNNVINNTINNDVLIKPKVKIQIVEKPFNIYDYNYWNQYNISLEQLNGEEIYSCKYIYLTTNKGITYKYESNKNNPIYAWKEYDLELNFIGWKVYMPNSNSKWLNNASNDAIQGIKTLKYNSNLLIITKSRKDILVYNNLGYEAISLASENIMLKINAYNHFNDNYDKIVINYDNDDEGIKGTYKLKHEYGFDNFYIDEYKDVSDYCKQYGLIKTKEMIDNKIKELK